MFNEKELLEEMDRNFDSMSKEDLDRALEETNSTHLVNDIILKDFEWTRAGVKYIVRNVPHEKNKEGGEEFLDMEVAYKLAIIRDLMIADKIPYDVDYSRIKEL